MNRNRLGELPEDLRRTPKEKGYSEGATNNSGNYSNVDELTRTQPLFIGLEPQVVLPYNPHRKYLLVQNNSTGDMWLAFSIEAGIGTGIRLLPGTVYEPQRYVPLSTVSIVGATGSQSGTLIETTLISNG